MTQSVVEATRTRLAAIEGELATLIAERADKEQQLAPLLALDPSSPAVAEIEAAIAELDSEIGKQGKRVTALRDYISKMEHNASAEAIAADRADGKAAAQRAAVAGVDRVKLGKEIDQAVVALAQLLATWDEAGQAILNDVDAAASAAHEGDHKRANQELHNIASAARGDAPGAFANAVRSLEGKHQARGGEFVTVIKPLGSAMGYGDTAEHHADRVALRCAALADKIAKAGK